MRSQLLICIALLGLLLPAQAFARLHVIYPNVNDGGTGLFGYAVLKLALENSGEQFDLTLSPQKVNNARIRRMIEVGSISISDFGSCPEFEEELLPIYFPIDMGLNGWRLLLSHTDKQPLFKEVHSVEDLRKMAAGQGIGWSDVAILENAGLKVLQAPTISQLFKMTEKQRFDYFPLGANEAHSLLEQFRTISPDIAIDEELLLIYPFGRLFFVRKDNLALRDAVYKGLIAAFENGSFQQLFRNHPSNSAIFTKAHLKERRQILLENPYLTEQFKAIPKRYFFSTGMLE